MTRVLVLFGVTAVGLGLSGCFRPTSAPPPAATGAAVVVNVPPGQPGAGQPAAGQPAAGQPTQPQSGIPRPDLRIKSLEYLRNIGLAYHTAAITGPVNGPDDLGRENKFISPRDNRPFEIVW